MLHYLGNTRSSRKSDHLLQTPDTFIRTPLPGAHGVNFVVHTAPSAGAAFTMMTAEFSPGGNLAGPRAGVQRFLYVTEGFIEVQHSGNSTPVSLKQDQFAYLPSGCEHSVTAPVTSKTVLIEKSYQPTVPSPLLDPIFGDETAVSSQPLGGDPSLQVRHLMPDGPSWDFAVNTMTYDPGASLAIVEIHVMEHGLLMLEGGGIYRLGDCWYPVTAGDFIWMAPYCPQWFAAIGKHPAKYLIYKDWYRHPLGEL